jgi:hypothetical protein
LEGAKAIQNGIEIGQQKEAEILVVEESALGVWTMGVQFFKGLGEVLGKEFQPLDARVLSKRPCMRGRGKVLVHHC